MIMLKLHVSIIQIYPASIADFVLKEEIITKFLFYGNKLDFVNVSAINLLFCNVQAFYHHDLLLGSADETTAAEMEAEHTGANNRLIQRFKRFISKRKLNRGNIGVGRIGLLVGNEDDNIRLGDDESSESEEDQHDGIPLVRRNKRK